MEEENLEQKKERLKREIKEKAQVDFEKRKIVIREYWDNLKPFNEAHEVPRLPRVEADEWQEFYVPKLIHAGAIPKDRLADGVWYYGDYRNSNFGKWDATKQEFGLWRYKFGFTWDTCNHFQDDNGYALFVPLRAANEEEIQKQTDIETERNNKKK
jgi:hypothetical protein